MTASEWAERARSWEKLTMADVNRLIADLAEEERSNRINLDALAESERLRQKDGESLSIATMDRDVWKQRAESKLAVWRETLQRCVTTAERVRVNFYGVLCADFGSPDHWPGDREGVINYWALLAALSTARELLEVTHE